MTMFLCSFWSSSTVVTVQNPTADLLWPNFHISLLLSPPILVCMFLPVRGWGGAGIDFSEFQGKISLQSVYTYISGYFFNFLFWINFRLTEICKHRIESSCVSFTQGAVLLFLFYWMCLWRSPKILVGTRPAAVSSLLWLPRGWAPQDKWVGKAWCRLLRQLLAWERCLA